MSPSAVNGNNPKKKQVSFPLLQSLRSRNRLSRSEHVKSQGQLCSYLYRREVLTMFCLSYTQLSWDPLVCTRCCTRTSKMFSQMHPQLRFQQWENLHSCKLKKKTNNKNKTLYTQLVVVFT